MVSALMSKIRRRVNREMSGFADVAISIPPVHDLLEKRYARDLAGYQGTLPKLSGVPRKIVDELQVGGVARVPFSDLSIPGTSELVSLAQRLVASEMDYFLSEAKAGNLFLMMRPATMIANPQLYLFGLNSLFLDIAEAYIGLPVGYDGVTIQHTVADGEEVSTRDWHRDREDRKMMKIIVYLNDVDSEGGPFQLLPRKFEEARDQRFLYLFTPEERVALREGKLGKPVDCEGPNGSLVFADTARFFHRGKPAVGRPRSAVFFSYFAQNPQRPFFCDRSGIPRREVRRMVQGLTPRQRGAALWQDTLALPWRMIPAASVI